MAVTLVGQQGLTWPEAMGLVVIDGIIIVLLAISGFRTAVFDAIPDSMKVAMSVGIGMFIAMIGLVDAGFVRRVPDAAMTTVPVQLGFSGSIASWPTFVFVIGLIICGFMVARNIPGGLFIGIVITTIISLIVEHFAGAGSSADDPHGWSLAVPELPSSLGGVPDLSLVGNIDLAGAFVHLGVVAASLLVFTLVLANFFDAMGTMTALGRQAEVTDEHGNLPDMKRALVVEGFGAVLGGAASSSSNTVFVDSSAGIADGARTGLATVVTGLLFLAAMFFSPLVNIVPFEAVAPALVVVGFLMVSQAVHVQWDDWGLGIPAFLTIAMMPFTYSIADGIGAGFVSFTFIRLVQGRGREVHPLMYLVSLAFLAYFGMGLIQGWTH